MRKTIWKHIGWSLACVICGWLTGSWAAGAASNPQPTERTRQSGYVAALSRKTPNGSAGFNPSAATSKWQAASRPWDPWRSDTVHVPIALFNFRCFQIFRGLGDEDVVLNDEVLLQLGIAEEKLPALRGIRDTMANALREAEVKHRKILVNDGKVLKMEIEPFDKEREQAIEGFRTAAVPVTGETTAGVLKQMMDVHFQRRSDSFGGAKIVIEIDMNSDGTINFRYAIVCRGSDMFLPNPECRNLKEVFPRYRHLVTISAEEAPKETDGSSSKPQ